MSKRKKSERVLDFMAGKGFYVILIACVAAIGVSGYMLLFNNRAPAPEPDDNAYIEWLQPSAESPLLEVPPDAAPVDGLDGDEGVLSVLKPTGIAPSAAPSPAPSAAPPSLKPVSPQPSAGAPAASPSAQAKPSAAPKPSPAPKPASKETPQFFWPVSGEILVPYAHDQLVFSMTMGDWRAHVGLDVACEIGTQVMAAADGTVKDVYMDPKLGTCVLIEHNGGMSTLYANLQEVATVKIDEKVKAGDVIGGIGATAVWESADESHLHFEVFKDGSPADPLDWLPKKN